MARTFETVRWAAWNVSWQGGDKLTWWLASAQQQLLWPPARWKRHQNCIEKCVFVVSICLVLSSSDLSAVRWAGSSTSHWMLAAADVTFINSSSATVLISSQQLTQLRHVVTIPSLHDQPVYNGLRCSVCSMKCETRAKCSSLHLTSSSPLTRHEVDS